MCYLTTLSMLNGKVSTAFYGRKPNANMPFYGQDANPKASTSGQRLSVQVPSGLLKEGQIGQIAPWTWSKAHMLIGDKDDRQKYSAKADPLQVEDRIPVMQGWEHLASAYAVKRLQQEIEDISRLEHPTTAQLAEITALAHQVAKGKKKAYELDFHDEFAHRFREWLRGNGSNDEYRIAGMMSYVDGVGNKRAHNKPISDHPSVIQYLSDWQSRVIEFDKKRTLMKLRMGRQGPKGEAASIDDLWKYYKFVVYGVEAEDVVDAAVNDFVEQEQAKPAAQPAHNTIAGPVPDPPAPATPLVKLEPVNTAPPPDRVQEEVAEVMLLDTHEQEAAIERARQEQIDREQLELKKRHAEEEAARKAREEEILRKAAADKLEADRKAAEEAARKAADERRDAELAELRQQLKIANEQLLGNQTNMVNQISALQSQILAERQAREQAQKAAQDAQDALHISNQQLHGNQLNAVSRIQAEAAAREQAQKAAQEAAEALHIANQQLLGNQQNTGSQLTEARQAIAERDEALRITNEQLYNNQKHMANIATENMALKAQLEEDRKAIAELRNAVNFLHQPAPQPVHHGFPNGPPPGQLPHGMDQITPEDHARINAENKARLEEFEREQAEKHKKHIADTQAVADRLTQENKDRHMAENLSKRGRLPDRSDEVEPRPVKKSLTPAPKPAPAPAAQPVTNAPTYQVAGQFLNQYRYYAKNDALKKADMVAPDVPLLSTKKLSKNAKEYHRKVYAAIHDIVNNPDIGPEYYQGKVTETLFPEGGEDQTNELVEGDRKIDIVKRYLRYIKEKRSAN